MTTTFLTTLPTTILVSRRPDVHLSPPPIGGRGGASSCKRPPPWPLSHIEPKSMSVKRLALGIVVRMTPLGRTCRFNLSLQLLSKKPWANRAKLTYDPAFIGFFRFNLSREFSFRKRFLEGVPEDCPAHSADGTQKISWRYGRNDTEGLPPIFVLQWQDISGQTQHR